MLIDPFTIVAQIVNFVILAAALKYFLYDRVIAAMDEREAAIARRLTEADEREQSASAELAEYTQRNDQFGRERHALLEEVRTEGARNRQRLLDRSRAEVADERQRWRRALEAEQDRFERELHRRTADQVIDLSRQALSDLAGMEIEAAIIGLGLETLADAGHVRDELFGTGDGQGVLTVRTAFELTRERRDEVTAAIGSMGAGHGRAIRFETDPQLILGIEFRSDDTSVGWNAGDYLDQLDARVAELAGTLDRSDNAG